MIYLFVGEKRSAKAVRMRVRWQDGRLAAKQLFDALTACGLDPQLQIFANLFVGDRVNHTILKSIRGSRVPVVAMGKRVQDALAKRRIDFIPIVHPAARGTIRRKDRYIQHIKESLCPISRSTPRSCSTAAPAT
jgi:hypothetical protein